MINLQKAESKFKEYVEQYDQTDEKVQLKIRHTYGVVRLSQSIARELDLSEEEIKLAQLIALLHDIGRFEQAKQFQNFLDSHIMDHAQFGVSLLFKKGLIRQFIQDTSYDDIIYKAIVNHNRYQIEEGLEEKELLHAKIIRDSDKADNFRVKAEEPIEAILNSSKGELETSKMSQKIYQDFLQNKEILREERKTPMDMWVSYLAFLFGFYFSAGLRYIEQKGYIDKMIYRLDYKDEKTKQQMEQIRLCAKEYINSKIAR